VRLLIYGINFFPELTGIGKFTGEMADWLARRGHSIEVVTTPPYYPEWRIAAGYSAASYRSERWPVAAAIIRVLRCPLWVPRRLSGSARVLHHVSFALSSLPAYLACLTRAPDMVWVVAPAVAVAPQALLLARLFRVPVWLHVQDFEVDAAFGMGLIQGGLARRLALWAESKLLRRFDRVSSISGKMVDRLVDKGVEPDRTTLFPNWVDLDAIRPLTDRGQARRRFGIDLGEVVVLYAGNMGEKQGLEVVVEAARRLTDQPSIRFVFAGAGTAKSHLEQLASGLPNVSWLPLQPVEHLNDLLNAADIHVLPQRADAADLVMPSKLTGMLASGRAIIGTAADGTQLAQVLDACAMRVLPGAADALASAIGLLAADGRERDRLGSLGRRYAEEHMGRDVIMQVFEQSALSVARTRTLR